MSKHLCLSRFKIIFATFLTRNDCKVGKLSQMNLKGTIGLLALVCCVFSAIGQNYEVPADWQEKIDAAYGPGYCDQLGATSPQSLEYLKYKLINSYYFMDYAEGKDFPNAADVNLNDMYVSANDIPEIDPSNTNDLNILLYKFTRDGDRYKFYKLYNTNKMIAFYSDKQLAIKFNELR